MAQVLRVPDPHLDYRVSRLHVRQFVRSKILFVLFDELCLCIKRNNLQLDC